MGKAKIAITLDKQSIGEVDRLVKEHIFKNRSQAIQEAIGEKLLRLKKTRLISESSKLDMMFEKELSDEGLATDVKEWPEY
ncbi:MAG: ribbon-helix-helix domain-containing protein [Dehalococcoidales bacterium]|nr:ribbon-helix-helix domain-containing protein [Dehalococcoidales bacterium]MDD4323073.1 ribbon-helix-helix domain-containing protein [Dehalococcoidales bacterium]MDD5122835.1 ribbon-helix-helix domain-containing protein [Dehalococcoidales bacterium]